MYDMLEHAAGLSIGVVRSVDDDGRPRVELADGSTSTPVPLWSGTEIDWRGCIGARALVAPATPRCPVALLVGLVDRPAPRPDPVPARRVEKVRHLRASEELILECGKAKISLRADGRVVILGGYLLSRASGVNKIKGGSVEIN